MYSKVSIPIPTPFRLPGLGEEVNTIEQIKFIDRHAEELSDEFLKLANQMAFDARNGVHTRYCVDFDVVRSALSENDQGYGRSFWSGAFLALAAGVTVPLPGMLYEAITFLTQKLVSLKNNSKNVFAEFFERAQLKVEENPESSLQHEYSAGLQLFASQKIKKKEYYLLEMLRQSCANNTQPLPEIDRSVFAHCTRFLANGARADRWINNRADAINYAGVYALNQQARETRYRYVLVSNTSALRKMDDSVCANFGRGGSSGLFARGFVISAREATMQRMLLKAADGSPSRAERLAFNLNTELANFRAELRNWQHRIRHEGTLPRRKFEHQKSLINVFSYFDNMDQAFERGDFSSVLEDSVVNFDDLKSDPSAFYEDLRAFVEDNIKESKYNVKFIEHDTNSADILIKTHTSRFEKFGKEYKLSDGFNDLAFILEDGESILYSFGKISLEIFLRLVNDVKSSLISKASLGEIAVSQNYTDDIIFVGVRDKEVFSFQTPSHADYQLGEIAAAVNALPADIHFVRIDNEMVSMSLEDGMVAIASKYKLPEELAIFMSLCTEDAYSNAIMQSAIDKYYNLSEFEFVI
jgi:hypothetical protein